MAQVNALFGSSLGEEASHMEKKKGELREARTRASTMCAGDAWDGGEDGS